MRTPLYDNHTSLEAKMVDFHGWEMPLQYSGIIDEHLNTRTNVCIFDVSHMGRFKVKGSRATDSLQRLVTNDVTKLEDSRALYSPMCYEDGGIVDDLIIFRINEEEFLIVVNASNREKDLIWITEQCKSTISVEDSSDETLLVAVQGPLAQNLVQEALHDTIVQRLMPFEFVFRELFGARSMVSRTGYTGEDGFEILFPSCRTDIWDKLMEVGSKHHIKAAGLGARDTLRMEAGLMLYGNDMDESTSPLEVPLKWTVKLEGHEFIGKKALTAREINKKLVGFEVIGNRIARHGNEVFSKGGKRVGYVTSGNFSPTFKKSIGFCSIQLDVSIDELIKIDIGGRLYEAELKSTTRFYKRK